jgi:hypothetical protein
MVDAYVRDMRLGKVTRRQFTRRDRVSEEMRHGNKRGNLARILLTSCCIVSSVAIIIPECFRIHSPTFARIDAARL